MTRFKGIIINNTYYKEHDSIITIITNDNQIINFIAMGTQKILSKNKLALNLFSFSEVDLFVSRTVGKLSKLKTAYLIDNFNSIYNDYETYLYFILFCDIIHYEYKQIAKKEVFNVFYETLINQKNDSDLLLINIIYFLFNAISWFGGKWNLNCCVYCNNTPPIHNFSSKKYGFVCIKCYELEKYKFDKSFLLLIKDISKLSLKYLSVKKYYIDDLLLLLKIIFTYLKEELGFYNFTMNEIKISSVFLK